LKGTDLHPTFDSANEQNDNGKQSLVKKQSLEAQKEYGKLVFCIQKRKQI
jgi:hypothetical protein